MVGSEQQRPRARQMLTPDAREAKVDEKERHKNRPERPVEDRVHAARQSMLAKPTKAPSPLTGLGPLADLGPLARLGPLTRLGSLNLQMIHTLGIHRARGPRYS